MTIQFGDVDPEDAWDDSDPVVVRLRLLADALVDIYREASEGNLVRASHRKTALRPAAHRLFSAAMNELEV